MSAVEVNFDGLPGPTHHFGGLAPGNLASIDSGGSPSSPRGAARQGIAKMRRMMALGLVQGIIPPHPRPALEFLRRTGYRGRTATVIRRAAGESPALLAAAWSSSAMWVANAATVSAAADTADGRVHFTTANLASQLHRAIEADTTFRTLASLFPARDGFVHHRPLPCALGDEGAANHTRLCTRYGAPGVSLFVHGRTLCAPEPVQPRLPARQVQEASRAVARMHRLDPARTVHARQLPAAIDAGVFHNDVISVGNRNLLLVHEQAFEDQQRALAELEAAMDGALEVIEVPAARIGLERAVASYLFNAQLVSPDERAGDQVLVAPVQCRDDPVVRRWLEEQVAAARLSAVEYVDLGQSMKNGGGPACLRLRVVLAREALPRLPRHALASTERLDRLEDWIDAHYPERIEPGDLADPGLADLAAHALAGVYRILEVPAGGRLPAVNIKPI